MIFVSIHKLVNTLLNVIVNVSMRNNVVSMYSFRTHKYLRFFDSFNRHNIFYKLYISFHVDFIKSAFSYY